MSLSLKYTRPDAALQPSARDFFEHTLGIDTETFNQVLPRPDDLICDVDADVVLLTTDCLETCFELRNKGISFSQSPSYMQAGLSAVFVDPTGNTCLLIEERDYSEEKELNGFV
ncbi:hypothetical protein [Pedobacter sp. SYP-B3415]|uniref:hypothetical protein n=1 Tax=Pedobacter sp. SYP-B3415 TaxID=2496641 RepID=UPI00101BE2B3|nr:hypothetical protein [Pedobacter sp. SYP-B3415]